VIAAAQKTDIAFYVLDTDPWNDAAERDLRRLAAETGGRYYLVDRKKQISSAIQEIEGELRNTYMVTFRADTSRTGIHQVTMKPNERNLKFFYRTTYYQSGPVETASTRRPFDGRQSCSVENGGFTAPSLMISCGGSPPANPWDNTNSRADTRNFGNR